MYGKITTNRHLQHFVEHGAYVEISLPGDEGTIPVIIQYRTINHMLNIARENHLELRYRPFDPTDGRSREVIFYLADLMDS